MGIFDSIPGVPETAIWTAEQTAEDDWPSCAALMFPDASADQLTDFALWAAWGTYADDYYARVFGTARDLAGARHSNARMLLFMPMDCGTTPPPTNPMEAGLDDLWRRTGRSLRIAERRAFRNGLGTMFASWLWEIHNHVQNRICDPVDYIEMRRQTLGSDPILDLARMMQGGEAWSELLVTGPMRELENVARDYNGLLNDIFSYQKEVEFEGELNNGVLVVQTFLDTDRDTAVLVVRNLMTQRMQQFERIVAKELPLFADRLHLDERDRETLHARVVVLQNWMAGVLAWHQLTARYTEAQALRRYRPESVTETRPRARVGGPSGLGYAAAHWPSTIANATPHRQPTSYVPRPTGGVTD